MKFNILITGDAYDSLAGYSALQFCNAALTAGHTIHQVFFYQSGVTHLQVANPLADEFNSNQAWVALAKQHNIPLVVCISAAERRGVLGEQDDSNSPHAYGNFAVEGLGSFHAACLESDRTVTFK